MNFTVLMCVYAEDSLEFFKRALESCTADQTVKPTEVLIIRNGKVSDEIEQYLDNVQSHDSTIHVIRLAHNVGLAAALNRGLKHVTTDWIARMDADDISLPNRFELQTSFLRNHPDSADITVLGTSLQEFTETSPDKLEWHEKRMLPTSHDELAKYARFQSPVHHPTVMIRTSALREVGGYPQDAGRFEDYLLWERLLLHGAFFANLSEVLLGYRVDSGAYTRRGGWAMLRDEVKLQKTFYKDGFTTLPLFIRNILVRGVYRLIPTGIKKPLYRLRTAVKNTSLGRS
ncbi:glycosyltransferase [Alloscardovia theropitheci]|uniref:Glycosyltransferase n=1 Tax=Alloscardovia theropitheci TaxID=2496842 RepID=A0A4R0QPL3_9BIFI|nr:glycosyltransferase [Alloscardovia theropitheci]TCD54163.1 glycosyltransferase [Alloscardovia theropitheci]